MGVDSEIGLTANEKAALLLISLGKESAAKIFKYLPGKIVEELTYEILNYKSVDKETKSNILKEFYEVCLTQEYITNGGVSYAREVLDEALGVEKSIELISRMFKNQKNMPFKFMHQIDSKEIFNYIQYEGDQTIALILSYIKPEQAAETLAMMIPERQVEIIKRIALTDKISPEIIKSIEKVMEKKFSQAVSTSYEETEGVEVIVNILNQVDRGIEKTIFEKLALQNNELAEEIKKRMFVFEDIIRLGNREVQRFLSEVDNKDLVVALKSATEELKKIIFSNLSTRIRQVIQDELEMLGAVRVSDVQKAQQKIVAIIRRLEESGLIIIREEKGDEIIG